RLSLPEIAEQVVSSIGGLPDYAERRIVLESSGASDELEVIAAEGEIKQVLLNLVINAIQALGAAAHGCVRMNIARVGGEFELSVADDGRGMRRDPGEPVFEPFFSDRKSAPERHGTGLGLSIVHAIVTDHGGSIRAESDGPGTGSRFIVRLPAA